jgi:hypothetical protein
VPAAGDINLFGGNQAQDLQLAGQRLGQASDNVFSIYERMAKDANDSRVQDLNNQFLNARRDILRTAPNAYYNQKGAEAISGAGAVTEKLKTIGEQIFGQAANGYQRQKLRPILDAHLAASADDMKGYVGEQQAAYARGVAAAAIETSQADAIADPPNMPNAVMRAEGAARAYNRGQPPEIVESEARKAGASVIAGVIGDRLARNDPLGVTLFRQYGERLESRDRRTLGAAAETLSNTVEAAAWLRDRSATLRTPAPTGDAALDAVNAASASAAEPPPVVSSSGMLLDQDGVAGTRQRLDEIEARRRALTALNEREFAARPARLRANQAAIDTDTARGRAAVKAETDSLYADLRRHLTTGGPGGGPAMTPPPATIMSRLTDAQQDAVAAQVNATIEGRKTATDPQTWYTIRQGLTGGDAGERQRWASTSLVPFMGRLSAEDYAALETLQATVRSNDGGAEQSRLQVITRMANDALRSVGIDPTPRPDAPTDSDAAQAARFHRALQDELSAFESSKGRTATAAEAQDVVDRLATTAFKGGGFKASNRNDFLIKVSDVPDGAQQPDAEAPASAGQDRIMVIDVPTDPESYKRFLEEHAQRKAAGQAATSTGGAGGAPATEPDSASDEYRAADAQARTIVAEQGGDPSEVRRAEQSPRQTSRGASMAVPVPPEWLPGSAVLGKLAEAVAQAARAAGSWVARAAPAAAGMTAGAAAQVAGGALTLIVIPTNSGSEYVRINENLRVRTPPGQDAKLELRVDNGLFGIGAKWVDLQVGAAWAYDRCRRYVAIDRLGLEQAIGRDAADAALGGNGIAWAKRPSKDDGRRRSKDGEIDEWGNEPQQGNSKPRDVWQNRPPQAEDLEQRPDQPHVPPHERSDEEIDEIAHKIVFGHASDKHRLDQKEFPELGSDTELQAHVADVIRKARPPASAGPADEPETESKKLRGGRTAYRHKDSGTTIVDDPLDEGTVLRPKEGRKYYDDLDKPRKNRGR